MGSIAAAVAHVDDAAVEQEAERPSQRLTPYQANQQKIKSDKEALHEEKESTLREHLQEIKVRPVRLTGCKNWIGLRSSRNLPKTSCKQYFEHTRDLVISNRGVASNCTSKEDRRRKGEQAKKEEAYLSSCLR